MARLHGNGDAGGERRLPREEVTVLNCLVLFDARVGDLLPGAGVRLECLAELVVRGAGGCLHRHGRGGGLARNRMRERLVLRRGGGDRIRSGECGALEVGGGEVGDSVSDRSAELGEGLLDLGGIVIGLGFVDLRNPWGREGMKMAMMNLGDQERA